jgi:hypothetical protein
MVKAIFDDPPTAELDDDPFDTTTLYTHLNSAPTLLNSA